MRQGHHELIDYQKERHPLDLNQLQEKLNLEKRLLEEMQKLEIAQSNQVSLCVLFLFWFIFI
jgi:hypothetical protein